MQINVIILFILIWKSHAEKGSLTANMQNSKILCDFPQPISNWLIQLLFEIDIPCVKSHTVLEFFHFSFQPVPGQEKVLPGDHLTVGKFSFTPNVIIANYQQFL